MRKLIKNHLIFESLANTFYTNVNKSFFIMQFGIK